MAAVAILTSAFSAIHHAEALATRLGEPVGTVILTLSVTGIEVVMISAFMYTESGNPSLARDAMFAVVMIVLNGMVGLSLVLGGLRYHEQSYNLPRANAFLAVDMPLAVLGPRHAELCALLTGSHLLTQTVGVLDRHVAGPLWRIPGYSKPTPS
ncbi:MAG: hypothetical protein U0231_18150 [Nitrospiraceae bacterium]